MQYPETLGLCTDLYELTMAQSYLYEGKTKTAVFSLFVRKLPERRNFLVSAGLETLIRRIERFRFSEEEIKYLRSLGKFKDDFLDYLRDFKFKGNVYAIGLLPERTRDSGRGITPRGSTPRNFSDKHDSVREYDRHDSQ